MKPREKRRWSAIRFVANGFIFTIIGPVLFWAMYPLGALIGIGISELVLHLSRYRLMKSYVFPASKSYVVSPKRYIVSVIPTVATSLALVSVLSGRLSKAELIAVVTTSNLFVGFSWSRFLYTRR